MKMSSGEFMNTLTGFEELAVKQMTGVSLDELTGDKERGVLPQYSLLVRALTAVKTMREEPQVKLAEAYTRAQKLSRNELADVFGSDDEDEALDEATGETVSESGKGELPTTATPVSSQSYSSEPA